MKRLMPSVLVLVACVIGSPLAWAQASPPQLLQYQGRLTDNSNNPLSGTFSGVFRFWDTSTGGNLLLTDSQSFSAFDGIYSVKLGAGAITPGVESSLNGVFVNRSTVHLEVAIDAETFSPRVQITSAGFALNSGVGGGAASGWTDEGSVVRLTTASDLVGIGINTPAAQLHLGGGAPTMRIGDGSVSDGGQIEWRNTALRHWNIDQFGSGPDLRFYTEDSANGAGATRVAFVDSGRVGIGTSAPDQNLHVLGSSLASNAAFGVGGTGTNTEGTLDFNATDFGSVAASHISTNRFFNGSSWTRRNSGFDGWVWLQRVEDDADGGYLEVVNVPKGGTGAGTDNTLLRITASGNVGIGTAAPNARLEINSGTANVSGLRFTSLTSASPAGVAGTKVLSVSAGGDVVLVTDATGGGGTLIPAGVVNAYAGAVAPSGWLLCDGSAVSRTTFADLFAVIGTTYGAGDGSTTFNLPDLRQRFPLGKAAAGTGTTLGGTGGAIDHSHTYSTVIAHTHAVDPPSTTSSSTGAHTHTQKVDTRSFTASGAQAFWEPGGVEGPVNTQIQSAGAHTHTTDVASFTSGSTGSASGATASGNPPFLVLNYIIKH